MSPMNIGIGAFAGLVVTVLITALWPRKANRWLRMAVAPLAGVLLAYLVMTQL